MVGGLTGRGEQLVCLRHQRDQPVQWGTCDATHILRGGNESTYDLYNECTGGGVKRLLTCVLVLGLIAVAPGPLSLCALASSLATDCASPETQLQCDQMDMGTPSTPAMTAQAASCCAMSKAPLPEAKTVPPIPSVESAPAIISTLAVELDHFENARLVELPKDTSPLPLQSLLCTFLI